VQPRITVLMPLYNAGPYVREAAVSILTGSFRDLELVAIDDGSTDDSVHQLKAIDDPRFRVISNPANLGLVATLNSGLELAEGEYVARMDADDVSMPDRLARQLAFMDANPEIGMSGTWARSFGAEREVLRTPLSPTDVHAQLFAYNAMCHPTTILRRQAFLRHALRFSPEAPHAEDLELWMRAAEHFPLANIPAITLRYRVHPGQVSSRHAAEQLRTVAKLQLRQLELLLPGANQAEAALHLSLLDLDTPLTHDQLIAAGPWLQCLEEANERTRRYDAEAFRAFLAQRWLNAAHRCRPSTLESWRTWRRSKLSAVGIGMGTRLFVRKALGR
jgi:glycosyltransferase involved in cell wall biosynthesis